MALTFIMTLCLLVYAACEYHLRKVLAEKELGVVGSVEQDKNFLPR